MALTETGHAGGFILSEANGKRSRENVTIVSGQNLKAGAVLGKITTGGKYAAYNNGASDGTQAAAAILIADCDASAADKAAAVIIRDAEVNKNELVYAVGQDQTAKDASIVDFAALGIFAR